MVTLSRIVRFAVNPAGNAADEVTIDAGGGNGYAGVPHLAGLGAFYELEVICEGEPDSVTGYFVDIKVIDRAVRATTIPHITRAVRGAWRSGAAVVNPEGVLAGPEGVPALARELAPDLAPRRGRLSSVRWRISPFVSVEVAMASDGTVSSTAVLRQRFEIAAAHRLHVPSMSDEENRAAFGKCNNPRGHGHNYVIEPAVEVATGADAPHGTSVFSLAVLEGLVDAHIVKPYDHTHLNEDSRAFNIAAGGVNPSVENIARVFYDALAPAVAGAGGRLRSIRVWETEKTSAEYGEA